MGAFGAAVYPMALVAARLEPTGRERVATALGPKTRAPAIPQRALTADGPWILETGAGAGAGATRIVRHLRTVCSTVGDRWSPQLGVKTGADEVFLVAQPGPATRPVVRGRDLRPWRATPRAHLLWTHGPDGRPLARLPAELARALDPHVERLCRRSDYRSGPAWQLFRVALADAPHRVIWPDLARRLAAVVPDAGVVPLNTVYGIVTRAADDAYALAALFNSRWLTALARLSADPARGGFARGARAARPRAARARRQRAVAGMARPAPGPRRRAARRHPGAPRRCPARGRRWPRQVVRCARGRPRARPTVRPGRAGRPRAPMARVARGTRRRGADRDARGAERSNRPTGRPPVRPSLRRRRSPPFPKPRHQPLPRAREDPGRCACPARHRDAGAQPDRRPVSSVPLLPAGPRPHRAGRAITVPRGAGRHRSTRRDGRRRPALW